MVTNRIIFFATSVQPNPEEIDYWVDLSDNPYGGSIKYFNGTEWVRLAASGGTPDLNNYYTKTQINNLLNNKADVGDVDSKVDDEEVKDVIKDIQFNTSNPNDITMVMFKYDGSNKTVSIPVASTSSAGIITSKDFLDFVKQHQLQELHTEMIDTFADIRAKYQKKLIAGLNIEIDQETNVISASGNLAVQWGNITNKPDFKPVATSGDYNDLINKLKPGKDVSISEDNTISIAIDSDSLNQSLATLQSNIDKEAATARAAETKLGNDIATEKNRAESAEQTISTNLQNEIDRSTQIDTQHTNAINKEVQDRKEAIATEVSDRNVAILVETNRAKAKEEELDNKITDHTAATNAALALKADKSDTYTKAQVDAKLSGAYKVKGSSTFEALPKDNNVVGDVYNITNAFNLGGKHYDAGTNVVWAEDGWDALSGSFDTTAIEGSIQEVADNLAQEILDRTQADTTINNNISSLTNRVKVNEDKLTIINGNESTTGSIANTIKQAKSYTDTTVTAEQTRAEKAEQKLTSDLASEVERAKGAESANATAIANEVTRAKGAESANATAIANEVERATGVEEALRTDVEDLTGQVLILEKTKVNKVEGKGLSTNDYTTPEKNKLAAIEAEANKYILPAATTTTLGGIIVGDRLSIDDTGKLVATYTYTLPTASNTVLGGVKIGSNITLADGGTISITKANVTSALGVDPTTTYVKKAGDTMTGALTNSSTISGSKLISTVATGTAPIQVSSTTLCTNLNADMVDGKNASDFQPSLYKTLKFTTNISNSKVVWCDLCRIAQTYQNYSILVQISALQSAVLCSVVVGYQNVSINILNSIITGNYQFNQVYPTLRVVNRDNQSWLQCTFQQGATDQNSGNNLMSVNITTSNNKITLVDSLQEDTMEYTNAQIYGYASVSNNFGASMNIGSGEVVDWYGVQWSETSSNPDCTRIGNMEMHRTLPIQSMMRSCVITNSKSTWGSGSIRYLNDDYKVTGGFYSDSDQNILGNDSLNIMVEIPEFWYIDEYVDSSKTHNLKICPHAKPGWNHHKKAYVGAYEGVVYADKYYSNSPNTEGLKPTVNVTRESIRTKARANGPTGQSKWNIYTYEEHRAICHLFLVEYATRNSQKAVNTALTLEGFRQGGLGSGCTTGTATINGAQTQSFMPVGSSNSLKHDSGEVTVTIQQTDSSGANTTTVTRKCNRYRGIENPFGHIWKHTDDIISIYKLNYRHWYKCYNPTNFSNNKNDNYIAICASSIVTGYKTQIIATPNCDFFARACTNNGSETTYWCDYSWDNTDASEHCLLIGGSSASGTGGVAGLFSLNSYGGVGYSYATIGSRLTYLPWAE